MQETNCFGFVTRGVSFSVLITAPSNPGDVTWPLDMGLGVIPAESSGVGVMAAERSIMWPPHGGVERVRIDGSGN